MFPPKIAAGVAFDPDVLEYLRGLCEEHQRDQVVGMLQGFHALFRELEALGVPTAAADYTLTLNLSYEESLVGNVPALLEHLNALLCAGSLSSTARTRITTALASLPSTTSATAYGFFCHTYCCAGDESCTCKTGDSTPKTSQGTATTHAGPGQTVCKTSWQATA